MVAVVVTFGVEILFATGDCSIGPGVAVRNLITKRKPTRLAQGALDGTGHAC